MSLRKETKVPEKTGPRMFETPIFDCYSAAEYWNTRKNKGQAYAIVLLRDKYNMPCVRADKEHIRGHEEKDKEEEIIKGRIVVSSSSIEDAKTYILKGKETFGKVLGVILPKKPEEQEKFWNDLVEKLESF